uniref:AlNc14C7G987 protein n=1 Tax=Albugo laibachii Nc14 TaxID=890382 RepID=F0W1Q7_9STRA|nr:AlNc14C7G987 [Albugo laibachii Nc14]|eukprot:CCA14986.1 AlNc14C7G987 [Albugo laibachii Nc14]
MSLQPKWNDFSMFVWRRKCTECQSRKSNCTCVMRPTATLEHIFRLEAEKTRHLTQSENFTRDRSMTILLPSDIDSQNNTLASVKSHSYRIPIDSPHNGMLFNKCKILKPIQDTQKQNWRSQCAVLRRTPKASGLKNLTRCPNQLSVDDLRTSNKTLSALTPSCIASEILYKAQRSNSKPYSYESGSKTHGSSQCSSVAASIGTTREACDYTFSHTKMRRRVSLDKIALLELENWFNDTH